MIDGWKTLALAVSLTTASASTRAVLFKGVEFPDGAISFADSVVLYDPSFGGDNEPTSPHRVADEALGPPDFTEGPGIDYVSLGAGGRLVVQFTDNSLTGSGDDSLDLWIFEVGPDVEDTTVEVSTDGISWFDVGLVTGSTSGVDIDASGFGTGDFFSFVRLTDVLLEGDRSGATVGADIDAVGAISSAPPVPVEPGPDLGVPGPASAWLTTLGLLGLLRRRMGSGLVAS